MKACEAAALKAGLRVAARTKRSLLLIPGPRRAMFNKLTCLAPGMGLSGRDTHAGHAITAELVPSEDGEGLAFAVATPSGAKRGEAFISALNSQLSKQGINDNSAEKPNTGGYSNTSRRTDDTVMHDGSAARFKSELCAYYYFSKLLLSEKEAPGMAAEQFVQRFMQTYKGVAPTAVEQGRPMRECMAAVDQLSKLVTELVANLEPEAYSNVRELQPWMRGSVERCVFARVGQTLWHLYDGRHSAEDAQYAQKARDLSRVSDAALLDALGVSSRFQGTPAEPASPKLPLASESESELASPSSPKKEDSTELEDSATRSTAAETEEANSRRTHPGESVLLRATLGGPYERAAAALSQIEVSLLSNSGRNSTPREAIEALTFSQFEMKTCVLEVTAGQHELCTMDDILPLFVFILVRSSLSKPFACSRFMTDALSRDEALESEGRAVLLLESAARHVAYDWDISSLLSD